MNLSLFELFTIGIGPSSSHTVGPMRAAKLFIDELQTHFDVTKVHRVQVEFFGSLGLTGKGHGSDKAVFFGLESETPEDINVETMALRIDNLHKNKTLHLGAKNRIEFDPARDLIFHRNKSLPTHSNGMRITAIDANQIQIHSSEYFSIGGGFILKGGENIHNLVEEQNEIPFLFKTAEELLSLCKKNKMSIAQLVMQNELHWRSAFQISERLHKIWNAMQACVDRGCKTEGILPGGLKVTRRAPALFRKLSASPEKSLRDPLTVMDWVNLYALAVNEENAAGSRIVTAPTNGAAGIIPAVLHYFDRFHTHSNPQKIEEFLLSAGAIGLLYKMNASISGAEVGCQGEVGVACSMAAAGLTAALGGTNEQIENAAEIGMEHNLGLTCDPIGGLVQIPCIERNAMGAMKAINASRIAMSGDGSHKVSLDKVIQTMLETGRDMQSKYKETSQGGLAANVVEC